MKDGRSEIIVYLDVRAGGVGSRVNLPRAPLLKCLAIVWP